MWCGPGPVRARPLRLFGQKALYFTTRIESVGLSRRHRRESRSVFASVDDGYRPIMLHHSLYQRHGCSHTRCPPLWEGQIHIVAGRVATRLTSCRTFTGDFKVAVRCVGKLTGLLGPYRLHVTSTGQVTSWRDDAPESYPTSLIARNIAPYEHIRPARYS
ncbi:hypothetical protein J6590_008046 [Homalodisca vitripennis]|nr:hypothetical protein J6590_008046 [Homalodisca vitripennis]